MFKIIENQRVYQLVSWLTAALYFYLFIMLLGFPGSFLMDMGVETTASAEFLARRAAMLMLGFAVLVFLGRKISNPAARQVLALAVSLNMAGFSVMSLVEFGRGFLNAGILLVSFIEAILAITYFLFWLAARLAEAREKQALP